MFGKRKKSVSTIGRRTGVDVVANKDINLQVGSIEDFNDYWTQSECSSPSSRSSEIGRTSIPDNTIVEDNSLSAKTFSKNRKLFTKGRRTGLDLFRGKNIKVDKNVEDFYGYWTDTHSEIETTSDNATNVCTSVPSTSTSTSHLLIEKEMQTNCFSSSQSSAASSTRTTPTKSGDSIISQEQNMRDGEVLVSQGRKISSKCKSVVSSSKGSLQDELSLAKVLPKKNGAKKKNLNSSEYNKSETEIIVSVDINESVNNNPLKKKKSSNVKNSASSKYEENVSQHILNRNNDANATCISNSNQIPSRLKQDYHNSETSFISNLSKPKYKKSEKSNKKSTKNKIDKIQQSVDPNITAVSVSNEENNLNFQQDKTIPGGANLTMPKSKKGKQTVTAQSRNVADADIEKIVDIANSKKLYEPSCRKSTRSRVGVLQFWRNERRRFNYKNEEVIYKEGEQDCITEVLSRKNARKPKISNTKVKAKLPDNSVNLNHIQSTIDKTAVTNPDTGEDEHVYLHRPYTTLLWSSLQSEDLNNSPFQFTKCFNAEDISFGYIEIKIKEKKEKQYSPAFNITLNVVKGQVRVTVNKRKIKLNELDTITIPISNIYSIDNIGKRKAVLFFCTFKAPMFQYQVSTSQL